MTGAFVSTPFASIGIRHLHVDNQTYRLRQCSGQQWFYGAISGKPSSPVKLHTYTANSADLARLQEILVPALFNDDELLRRTKAWKTFDPNHAFGITPAVGDGPSAESTCGKAFTIYTDSATEAYAVLKRLDGIICRAGLGLRKPLSRGLTDIAVGESNRLSLVLDTPEQTVFVSDSGVVGKTAKVQSSIVKAIALKLGLPEFVKLTRSQIQEIEMSCGIMLETLVYAQNGALSLIPVSANSQADHLGGIYLDECGANKAFGSLTDRAAYYALARFYKLDPSLVAIEEEQNLYTSTKNLTSRRDDPTQYLSTANTYL